MPALAIDGIEQPICPIVLGTATGEIFTPDNYERAAELLDAFVALGGNCVDTAHVYGGGDSERTLGRWLRERGNREQVVVLSKGCHPRLADFQPRLTRAALREDLAESLARLQTDYIDLYLLHRDDESVPVGAIVEMLNEAREAGQIRAFGGSNWRTERLAAANAYAAAHGLVGFTVSSPSFSLAEARKLPWPGCVFAGATDRAWYEKHQFPLIAWSSQASGFMSGQYSPADRSRPELVEAYYSDENFERLRRATELGRQKGVGPIQIGLAYVLSQPFPTGAIVGCLSIAELEDSWRALDLPLTAAERRYLERGTS